ncbi:hypothetical protein LUZ60_005171 [Juncus effusus]|nr:hypothetical protein LUZ60_005171 [Juncus effusus]
MAGRLIGWRPWPPHSAKRFQTRLVVERAENAKSTEKLSVELKWKGPKAVLRPLRRGIKRNCTREEELRGEEGIVEWNEEFLSTVTLIPNRERNGFNPWEVTFALFNGPKSKATILGMASLNLAEYPAAFGGQIHIILSLLRPNSTAESPPVLHISLGLLELGPTQSSPERPQKPPAGTSPVSPPSGGDSSQTEKDENAPEGSSSVLKAGLRKMKALKQLVPSHKSKKNVSDESSSDPDRSSPIQTVSDTEAVLSSLPPSLSPSSPSPSVLKSSLQKVKILKTLVSKSSKKIPSCDTDSLSSSSDSESDLLEVFGSDPTVRKSFSYGPLTSSHLLTNSEGLYEDWVYYSDKRAEEFDEVKGKEREEERVVVVGKRSLLPWRKRKLSYVKAKGEPLLKKAYAEEGGDDIDFDRRRVLSSSDESVWGLKDMEASGTGSPSDDPFDDPFGDGRFTIGQWEPKQILSRDGQFSLSTSIFFSSIDQRHERAAGESACAVLVAIIADWFQLNPSLMPVRSQIDTLIRDGSLVWRNLCKEERYHERFPDGHFDLDTVLDAEVRQLAVAPDKSFVGFFHPDGDFEFLHGSMSFDGIWDEIEKAALECEPDSQMIYIVSWNDHFFVLKVEKDAYYIVDTLGERLYEGCDRAYILKFDENTTIYQVKSNESDEKEKDKEKEKENEVVCKGKEACREYIKAFLAAIPIRELQEDIKKGRVGSGSAQLHQRLQIEFHYTKLVEKKIEEPFPEVSWPVFEMSEMSVRGFSEVSNNEGFADWSVAASLTPKQVSVA